MKLAYAFNRVFRLPRKWSNRELKKFACLYKGAVINISGWKDSDKESGLYRDFFFNASSYCLSNISGDHGAAGTEKYILNLENEIPSHLHGKFDVVFNHTTLEHVFDIKQAFRNLCPLSRDTVILLKTKFVFLPDSGFIC